ncbi:hypothetical protein [Paenibacillus agri]|uniref:DUF2802 domain-containing protein n=1 Tax=Paenibacillus agri TaxID=2744309 RepID=A0A850EJ51_9BACL|nr:hypothetical protein [Paenibacillus agri]NUU61393.1 hypothetical protein [Paenibacillus agri]
MQPWGYIVLVGAVTIVYALIMPARAREGKKTEQQSLKETEAALELYMADMERENEELVQLVSSIKQQSQSNQATLTEQIMDLQGALSEQQEHSKQLEARMNEEAETLRQLAASLENQANIQTTVANDVEHVVAPPEIKPKPVSSIKLRYPRLFELHEEGKSIDSIAKTAGLQRGEVQLILQLAKQEESIG